MNESLPEARLAEDDGAIVILESAGDNFRSGRGIRISQYDQRRVRYDRTAVRVVISRIRTTANAQDALTGLQEELRNVEALIENPAGIPAHIENDPLRAFGRQLFDGGLGLFGGVLIEYFERQIADLAVENERVRDRRDVNQRASELQVDR